MYAGVAREACTPSPSLVMPDRKAVDFELLEGQGWHTGRLCAWQPGMLNDVFVSE